MSPRPEFLDGMRRDGLIEVNGLEVFRELPTGHDMGCRQVLGVGSETAEAGEGVMGHQPPPFLRPWVMFKEAYSTPE